MQNIFSIRMRISACISGQWEMMWTRSLCSWGVTFVTDFCHLPRIALQTYNSTAMTTGWAYLDEAQETHFRGRTHQLTHHTASPSRVLIKRSGSDPGIWKTLDRVPRRKPPASTWQPWLRGKHWTDEMSAVGTPPGWWEHAASPIILKHLRWNRSDCVF